MSAVDPQFLSLKEASARISTSPETIRYWIWQGRLRGYKPGRAVLVKISDLDALVEGSETRALRARAARKAGA